MVYFLLAIDDEGEGRSLYSADGENLPVLSIFQGVKACGVHAEEPIANSPAESCHVERLVVLLVLQMGKTLTNGFVGH